jgi:serine/threonine protein kinase
MPIACPTPQTLEHLLSGPVGPAETDRLASHLEECERCAAAVDRVLDRSGLMALLKSHARAALAPEPQVQQLIGRARALKAGVSDINTPSLVEADISTSPPVAAEAVRTRQQSASDLNRLSLGLLEPSKGPDELGWLAQYRILKQLGAGGMGVVLLAEDTLLQRRVALKVMQPALAADRTSRDRFVREARAAAKLAHDHVVTIHQVGEANGAPFLAMQLLQGKSLDAYLSGGGKLSPGQVCRVGRETALGLAAAHAKGLIHRDIKPANLWLEAPKGRVKILDFGLARPADDAHLTGTGMALGTPAYMSPEQARGQSLDGRCDLWSLGVVLYRLCAGQLPFQGGDVLSIFTAIAVDEPAPLTSLNPDVPPALAELVHQLLAKDREKRPATVQEVADRLLAVERVLAKATPSAAARPASESVSPALATSPPRKRRPLSFALAGGLLPVLVLAGWIIIKIQHKDGTTSEIQLPDDAKVTIEASKDSPHADATPSKQKENVRPGPDGAVIDLLDLVDVARGAEGYGSGAGLPSSVWDKPAAMARNCPPYWRYRTPRRKSTTSPSSSRGERPVVSTNTCRCRAAGDARGRWASSESRAAGTASPAWTANLHWTGPTRPQRRVQRCPSTSRSKPESRSAGAGYGHSSMASWCPSSTVTLPGWTVRSWALAISGCWQ